SDHRAGPDQPGDRPTVRLPGCPPRQGHRPSRQTPGAARRRPFAWRASCPRDGPVHQKTANQGRLEPMFRLKKTLTAIGAMTLALATAAPVIAQDRPGEGVKITMARPTWDTGWFQTEIYSQML